MNEKWFVEIKDHFLERNSEKVTDDEIKSKIKIQEALKLEDYTKVMFELQNWIDKENIKLIIIDNIASVCDHFINNTTSLINVDFIERANFLLKHSNFLKTLAF